MRNFYCIFFLILIAMATHGQIPNGSFENWTTVSSYSMPDQWDNLNPSTAGSGIFTCTKGTPGSPGSAYLRLTTKDIPLMGIVPGVAVCGVLDQVTRQPVTGFSFTLRPQNFTGKWQFMMFGSGLGFIDITLTRWDVPSQSRKTVASIHQPLTGMEMSWSNFTIPFIYSDGQYPDTCMFFLSSSGTVPAEQDYLYLDNLQFQGAVTGIEQASAREHALEVFPDPADEFFTARFTSVNAAKVRLVLCDRLGRTVREVTADAHPGENRIIFDSSPVPAGLYMLKLITGSSTASAKIMIR